MTIYGEFRCYKARNGNLIIDKQGTRSKRAVYNVISKKVTYNSQIPERVIEYFVGYFTHRYGNTRRY